MANATHTISERTIAPLSSLARDGLMFLAFAGSAAYAFVYLLALEKDLFRRAAAVGVAAGASWIIFGFVLLGVSMRQPSGTRGTRVLNWMDTCLIAIGYGMCVKMVGLAVNLFVLPLPVLTLLAADVVMGVFFVQRGRALGVSTRGGLGLWLLGLNLPFAVILTALLLRGGVA